MKAPECCGKEMSVRVETTKYVELECRTCRDVVYIKKDKVEKPRLLDD